MLKFIMQGHFLHCLSGRQQCSIFKTIVTQAGGIVGSSKAIKVKWFILFNPEGHESVAECIWSSIQSSLLIKTVSTIEAT